HVLAGAVATTTGGHQPPLGIADGARVRGYGTRTVGGADDERVDVAVVGAPQLEEADVLVARGEHGHGAVAPGVLNTGPQGRAGQRREQEVGVAEAEIDDLGTMVDRPPDAGGDVIDRTPPVLVHRLRNDKSGIRGHTGHAAAVAGGGSGDARYQRAVAMP